MPADARMEEKAQEKMDRYQDFARELKRLWKVETTMTLIVVGALGTVVKGLEKNLKKAGSNVTADLHFIRGDHHKSTDCNLQHGCTIPILLNDSKLWVTHPLHWDILGT